MDKDILSVLMSQKPELYAIFALVAYLGKKYWPLLKEKIEIQRSQLEGDLRREKKLDDIFNVLVRQESRFDALLSKDDAIDLLLTRPDKVNGSGSIAKKGI